MSTQLTLRSPFSLGLMTAEKKEKFIALYYTFCEALRDLRNEENISSIDFVSEFFVRDRLLSIINNSFDNDILRTKMPVQEKLFQTISGRCQSMYLDEQKHLTSTRQWMSEELFPSWPVEIISIISDYQKRYYW